MNGLPGTPTTNSSGYYSATVDYGWSGTATPNKAGYTFSPSSRNYSNVTSNRSNENYTGTLAPITISGHVRDESGTGVADVVVTADNDGGSTITDADGRYELSVPYGWSGVVEPAKTGYAFDPTSRSYSKVTKSDSFEDYRATTVPPPNLEVSPNSGLQTSGNPGGPFSPPTSKEYTLTNTGGLPLTWSAVKTVDWLTLSANSGDLEPDERAYLTVSINEDANDPNLNRETHTDTVSFRCEETGQEITRSVSLKINTTFEPWQDAPLRWLGPQGGPFVVSSDGSKSHVTFTLRSKGAHPVEWSAAVDKGWVTLSPARGTVQPHDEATFTVSINANANSLESEEHAATLTLMNHLTGNTRTWSVTLDVASGLSVEIKQNPSSNRAPGTGRIRPVTLTAEHLGGSGDCTCEWSTGETTFSIIVNPSRTTTYKATVTDSLGQVASAEKTVTVTYNLIVRWEPDLAGRVEQTPANQSTFDSGDAVHLRAVPAEECDRFVAWTEGDLVVSTEPEINLVMDSDREITALFHDGEIGPGTCFGPGVCQIGLMGLAIVLLVRPAGRRVGRNGNV